MTVNLHASALSRRTVLAGAAGAAGAGIAACSGFGLEQAYAGVKAPTIHSTSDWGARRPDQPLHTIDHRPTVIVIHHTATPNSTDLSREHAFALARQIQSFHMDDRKWGDSGQQFTVSRGGVVMEARTGSLQAARGGKTFIEGIHAPGSNQTGIGIENEGTYANQLPPQAQRTALVQLVAWLCSQYQIPASNIIGHRDSHGSQTSCPGDRFHAELRAIRAEVAKILGQGAPSDPAPKPAGEWPTLHQGAHGEPVRVAQLLLHGQGQQLDIDASFGAGTLKAVKAFQQAKKLSADGVLGPQTWAKLATPARQGTRGDLAKAVQTALVAQKVQIAVDGSFGAATTKAVQTFQKSEHLEQDGIVGPLTWQALLS